MPLCPRGSLINRIGKVDVGLSDTAWAQGRAAPTKSTVRFEVPR